MKAKIKRNWWGVPELIYECPKCRCTLTSSRKEVEAGKDVCPECRNVFDIPPSLLNKFDEAETRHQETLAVANEDQRQEQQEQYKSQTNCFWEKRLKLSLRMIKKHSLTLLIAIVFAFFGYVYGRISVWYEYAEQVPHLPELRQLARVNQALSREAENSKIYYEEKTKYYEENQALKRKLASMNARTERDQNKPVSSPKSFWDSEKFRNAPEKVQQDMIIFQAIRNAGYSDAEALSATIQTMDQ